MCAMLVASANAGAQSSSEKEKAVSAAPSNTDFKKQTRVTQKGSTRSGLQSDSVAAPVTESNTAAENINATQVARPFDYSRMPDDVRLKMDANKAAGKELLDGVLKAFTVQIAACQTKHDADQTLRGLTTAPDVVRAEFVSPGLVRIVVRSSFDSVALKDLMLLEKIGFNFINEYYLLPE